MPVILNPYGVPLGTSAGTDQGPEQVDGRAVIAYDSIFRRADLLVTADYVDGYPPENAFDDLTYDDWQTPSPFGSGGESDSDFDTDYQYLTASFDEAVSCDYVAIALHDLYSKNAVIDFQRWNSDISEWESVLPNGGFVPVSDSPFLVTFDLATSTSWRLRITTGEGVRIGILFAGIAMPLQRFVRVGHVPAPFNEELTQITNESEGGHFIGRSLVRRSNVADLQLSWLTPTWVREHWKVFQQHARTLPFFFAWDRRDFPDEVIFGYADSVPRPALMNPLYEAVNLRMRGIA
jgi:hypothetical protein